MIAWLHELGIPHPVEYNIRQEIERRQKWAKRRDTAIDVIAKTALALMVTGLGTMLVRVLLGWEW